MRRTILIIAALVGALGVRTAAFAQEETYPDQGMTPPPPAEEAVPGDDYASEPYDDESYQQPADNPAEDQDVYNDADDLYLYNQPYAPGGEGVSLDTFRASLSPYGRWVQTPEYGLVWIPSPSVVGANFVPYATGGTWRYSDYGWTFATSWNWGWAPFHYGRWFRTARWGWVWLPGRTWAPAWVDWRFGDGYIGWAPLPPRRFVYLLDRPDYWFFCPARDILRPRIAYYRVRPTPYLFRATYPARRPFVYGRYRWFAGPSPRVVERVIHRPIQRVTVRAPQQVRVVNRIRIENERVRYGRATPAERRRYEARQQLERQQRIERQQRQQRIERQQRVQQQERQQRAERQQRVQQQERQQRAERQQRRDQQRLQNQQRLEHQQRAERQQRLENQQRVNEQQRAQMREQHQREMRQAREQNQQARQQREQARQQNQQARQQREQARQQGNQARQQNQQARQQAREQNQQARQQNQRARQQREQARQQGNQARRERRQQPER
jgi:DNA segregation ATPase FtsK/SpoIIIE-like protein